MFSNHRFRIAFLLLVPAALSGCSERLPVVEDLTLSESSVVLEVSESVSLAAESKPVLSDESCLYWSSDDVSVAVVSSGGQVTGVSEGETVVRVSYGGVSDECVVKVVPKSVSSISFDEGYYNVELGKTVQVVARMFPGGGDPAYIEWTVDDPSVASVDGEGNVSGIKKGSTVLRAKHSGKEAECTIYVYGDPQPGDYYYADGSYSTDLIEEKDIVAMVFWAGDPTSSDETLKKEKPGCTHGLAVSLNEDMLPWMTNHVEYDNCVDNWRRDNTKDYMKFSQNLAGNKAVNTVMGYNNTAIIKAFNDDEDNYWWKVDLVSSLSEQQKRYSLPELSSGWYIPSAKELSLMCTGKYSGDIWNIITESVEMKSLLNGRMAEIKADKLKNDFYWSSSEMYSATAGIIDFTGGYLNQLNKDISVRVRYVLAF